MPDGITGLEAGTVGFDSAGLEGAWLGDDWGGLEELDCWPGVQSKPMLWTPMLQDPWCSEVDGSWHLTADDPPHWVFWMELTEPALHDFVYEHVWELPS